jgi:hypothetical protein
MVIEIIQKIFNSNNTIKREGNNTIKREDDLKPMGVKYTVRGNYSFNETFEHMFRERLKS